jgi:hypothetical protein
LFLIFLLILFIEAAFLIGCLQNKVELKGAVSQLGSQSMI